MRRLSERRASLGAESAQLPFDLQHRPALGREEFVVAPGNAVAVAWIDRWPDWPAGGLAIYGPPGCGKSHLAEIWRAASGAVSLDLDGLLREDPPLRGPRTCVLDGVDAWLSRSQSAEPERRLFHLYNLVLEARGHLLLTGRSAPARWCCGLADLSSRLAALPAVGIAAPDEALIEALLVKLFSDRQLRVEADVIRYLVPRLERSFAAARAVVIAIDRASLAERREITVPLARAVLDRESAHAIDQAEIPENRYGLGDSR